MHHAIRTVLSCLLLAACVKDDPAEDVAVADVHTVIDHVYTERGVLPVPALVNALRLGSGHWADITSFTCASVDSITGDTALFPAGGPVAVYLSFPDTGCVDIDLHRRAGHLRITLTNAHGTPGATMSVLCEELMDNGLRYRFGLRDSTLAPDTFQLTIDSSFIHHAGDWGRRITGTGRYHWTSGQGDDDPLNDTYALMYTGSGIDRDGRAYTFATDTALVFTPGCPWVEGGVETIAPSDLESRGLDYGSGTCEDHCVIDVGGEPVGLTIP